MYVKERSLQSRIVELESQLSQTRTEVSRQKREKADVMSVIVRTEHKRTFGQNLRPKFGRSQRR